MMEKLEPIRIRPNAKLIGMLNEIAGLGDVIITNPVLYKNQSIIEISKEELLNPFPETSPIRSQSKKPISRCKTS